MQTKLILFSGLPGSGKSTFAGRLAREMQLPLLCIDDVIGEVGTALFVDTLHPTEQNYADVLHFVTNAGITLKPLEDVQLVTGKYH